MTEWSELMDGALAVREHAHAPYSGYRVGAAVMDEAGRVHAGCNVENAAYPEGLCAEAGAIAAMVAAGGRRIRAIAVAGGHDTPGACTPCGGCRQKIREFADADTRIVLLDGAGATVSYGIDDLLPYSFLLQTD
ncbi:cytidine deaminase [Lentisalinibacter salinarum]|uniref:cytidine deaminase n=1 Tax=Lentisalinibacter salinarum TaxID=2992239 RepID=UPI00386738CC